MFLDELVVKNHIYNLYKTINAEHAAQWDAIKNISSPTDVRT